MPTPSSSRRSIDAGAAAMTALAGLALAGMITAIAPAAHAEESASLTVKVSNIAAREGVLRLGLFDENGYESGGGLTGASIKVDGSDASATFEGLTPGEYAVKLYHDVDDNGEMNTNPFGMPTEPFAFSNNAKGRFGPAAWEAAKFEVPAGASSHDITMD